MAVLLTWALFVVWATVGLAVLKLGRFRWSLPTLLFAPTVGFATLVVPTYILVRFGVPVGRSAVPVGAALLLTALVVLWRTRPAAARARRLWKHSRAFVAVLVGAFVLTAWPLFGYGFDWVANGNDDMANYCMTATGYRDHGYAQVPTAEELCEGRDPTQAFWFFYILLQVRSGSDVLLALTSTWTGLSAQQTFMPVIVALNLALVAAASGLAVVGTGRRGAVLAGALLAVSAATTYGVVQQLIAQAGGLALLCTALALVSGRFRRFRGRLLARRAGACGVVFTGLLVVYPEVIPILVGACVVLGVRELTRGRMDRRHLVHAGAAIAVMAALVPVYLYGAAVFLASQTHQAQSNTDAMAEVFPYLLTPRGPALVCGFLPLAGLESAALQSFCAGAALVLLVGLIVPAGADLFRRRAFAAALCVIAVLGAGLYAQRAGFGLFKLAMFAQPFLWIGLAAWVVRCRRRAVVYGAAALVVAVVALNARTQYWYVNQSRGHEYRVELPAVTTRHALTEFRGAYARRAAGGEVGRVLLATENNVLAKLIAAEVRGVPVAQMGISPLDHQLYIGLSLIENSPWVRLHGERRGELEATRADVLAARERGRLTIRDTDTGAPLHRTVFATPDRAAAPDRTLVVTGVGPMSVFNRSRYPESGPAIVCAPLSELRNFAVFCDATGARQLYYGMDQPENVALYQLEVDPVFRKRTMASIGRALVLDVINPTPQVRVLVNYTAANRADPAARTVAPIRVVGDRRVSFGGIGSGSARLVSPPLATQAVGNGRFLALDFGEAGRNANNLSGVEKLWGAQLSRDRRYLTGHLRDVSVLSEEDYAAFRPPVAVNKFPDDLTHPHLEYSGVYEHGWSGKEFKFRLTQPAPGHEVVLRGHIPQFPGEARGFRTELTVLLDGKPVEARVLSNGEFEVRAPGGPATGPRWVEYRFTHDKELPAPDGRRAVAHVRSVGFEPYDESKTRPPEKLAKFPADLSHPKGEVSGLFVDGWSEQTCSALVWQTGPDRDVVVRGQVVDFAGSAAFRTELTLLLDGAEVAKRELAPGEFEVRAPAGDKTAQARRLECRFSNVQTLPKPDGRSASARLWSLGFEPPAK